MLPPVILDVSAAAFCRDGSAKWLAKDGFPYLQSIVAGQVSFQDVNVGMPLQLFVFGYLVNRPSLVSDDTYDGIIRVFAQEREEGVLMDRFSMEVVPMEGAMDYSRRYLWKLRLRRRWP
jgi:hypothetical protein